MAFGLWFVNGLLDEGWLSIFVALDDGFHCTEFPGYSDQYLFLEDLFFL